MHVHRVGATESSFSFLTWMWRKGVPAVPARLTSHKLDSVWPVPVSEKAGHWAKRDPLEWLGMDRDAASEPKVNPQALQFWDISVGLGMRVTSVSFFGCGGIIAPRWERGEWEENIAAGIGDCFVRRDDRDR